MSRHSKKRLQEKAHTRRDGWYEEILRAGVDHGDEIELTHDQFHALRVKYNPQFHPRTYHRQGLGDLLHAIALPIARLLKLPCIDKKTGQLNALSPCAIRRKNLNMWGWTVGQRCRAATNSIYRLFKKS